MKKHAVHNYVFNHNIVFLLLLYNHILTIPNANCGCHIFTQVWFLALTNM